MPDGGPLLAIDSSSATASVAVYRDQVLAECVWKSGRRHSAELLPTIESMLALAETEQTALSAIAVAAGPGSYSGIRVAVSTAIAMAFALGIGVIQVPTLDVIAWGQLVAGSGDARPPIRAAIEVGRGRFATARFRRSQQLEHESRIENVGLGELLELSSAEHAVLAVDLDPEARATVERQYGARVELVPPASAARRAAFLAELAAERLRRGEPVDTTVEPIYLH